MFKKILKSIKRVVQKIGVARVLVLLFILVSASCWFLFFKHKTPPYDHLTQLLNSRQYSEVIKEGEPYLEEDSQDEKLATLLARAYFAFGISQSERDLYTSKALSVLGGVAEKSVNLLMTKGYIYFSSHNPDGARLAYQEVLILDPKNTEAMVKLAQVYESDIKISESEKLYKKVLALDPGNHEAIIGYLRIKVIYKQYDFVFNKVTEMLKYAKNNDFIASLSELLATEYGRKKDFDNAEKMYREVLRRQPMRVASLIGLADVFMKTVYRDILKEGNTVESLTEEPKKLAEQAIKIDKSFIYSYLVLLDVARLRGDTAEIKKNEDIVQNLFKTQKFLASEKELIKSRLTTPPKAKVTIKK